MRLEGKPKLPKRWFPKYGNNIIRERKTYSLSTGLPMRNLAVLRRREEVEPMLAPSFTTEYRFFTVPMVRPD